MGKLVDFEKRRRRGKAKPAGDAQILMFTGVRYERSTVLPGKPPGSHRPKRKRG